MCKYLFFKKPFINVGTNEENIHENFVCFIYGGAGPLHQLRNTAPGPLFWLVQLQRGGTGSSSTTLTQVWSKYGKNCRSRTKDK